MEGFTVEDSGGSKCNDEEPLPDVDSEVVDFRAASELFAPVRTLRRNDLRTLRLLTTHQGHHVPTIGGVLLFGQCRNPEPASAGH